MRPGWEALFDELVDLAPDERAARLAAIAGEDGDLARFLGALLAADAQPTATLGRPLAERAPDFLAAALAAAPAAASDAGGRAPQRARSDPRALRDRSGERIGHYRLLHLLGRGGMAEVYLGERADGEFEQRVAVKRILHGLASPGVYERFLRERQILAQLEHPNIARLLDGGRTDDGDPYFVLEAVDGVPITEFCAPRDGRPPIALEQRLRLLLAVCEAVELAHSKLIVHRDLKPSNILVTPDGRPKLLDFGIAKLLEGDGVDDERTRVELLAFTPAYAAPEQVLGQPVTTATDVFALGVLMYELLTGTRPFARPERPLPALARAVSTETVERASTALRRAASGARTADVERRARRLEGDLDTIVAKALASDPARRYPTAAALAEDLRRHLARRPILARPDSLRYRAGRFVARNRLAVLAASLVLLSLVGGLAIALWQAQVARREARRAERVRDFLVQLFQEADPSGTRGETITAREVLGVGARRLQHDLAAEPGVQAELLDAIAQVEVSLGLPEAARLHAERALLLRRRTLGDDDPQTAATRLTRAEALFALGDLAGSSAELERAAPRLPPDRELERRRDEARIQIAAQRGEGDRALALARQRLQRVEATLGPESLDAGRARLTIAGILSDTSKVREGLAEGEKALAIIARAPGVSSVQLARAERDVGNLLDNAGDRVPAIGHFAAALRLQRKVLGADHPEVAFTEIPYGFSLEELHRYDEAEAVLGDAIRILRPIGHYELASALRYLGFTYQARDRWAEAQRCFAEAASIYHAKLGEDSPLTRGVRLSEAWALAGVGKLPEAEAALRAVAAAIEKAEGPQANPLRTALKYLGEVRRRRGDAVEALALHRRARGIEVAIFGTTEHRGVAASDLQIVLDLLALGHANDLPEAKRLADEGVVTLRKLDAESPRLQELVAAQTEVARRQRSLVPATR